MGAGEGGGGQLHIKERRRTLSQVNYELQVVKVEALFLHCLTHLRRTTKVNRS